MQHTINPDTDLDGFTITQTVAALHSAPINKSLNVEVNFDGGSPSLCFKVMIDKKCAGDWIDFRDAVDMYNSI